MLQTRHAVRIRRRPDGDDQLVICAQPTRQPSLVRSFERRCAPPLPSLTRQITPHRPAVLVLGHLNLEQALAHFDVDRAAHHVVPADARDELAQRLDEGAWLDCADAGAVGGGREYGEGSGQRDQRTTGAAG